MSGNDKIPLLFPVDSGEAMTAIPCKGMSTLNSDLSFECLTVYLIEHCISEFGENDKSRIMEKIRRFHIKNSSGGISEEYSLAIFCSWILEMNNCMESPSYIPENSFLSGENWYLNPDISRKLYSLTYSKIRKSRAETTTGKYEHVPLGVYPKTIFIY